MKKIWMALMLAAMAMTTFGGVIGEDTMEFGLQGNLNFNNPDGNVDFTINSSLGYFIIDNVQAGGMLGMLYDGHDMGYSVGGFGEINFDIYTHVVPYLAVRPSLNFGSHYEQNHLLIDFAAGLKFFLSETVAISTEFYYDLASKEVFAQTDGDDGRNTDAGIRVGLRYYF